MLLTPACCRDPRLLRLLTLAPAAADTPAPPDKLLTSDCAARNAPAGRSSSNLASAESSLSACFDSSVTSSRAPSRWPLTCTQEKADQTMMQQRRGADAWMLWLE
jgi:hypothetical protein